MLAHAIEATRISTAQLGWVAAHDIRGRDEEVLLSKGAVLDHDALERLKDAASGEAHLVEMEPGELHEDAAGLHVARCVAGDGLRVAGPVTSRYDLVAERRGLLRVDATLVLAVNQVAGVTLYTVLDCLPVVPGTTVASVKITPLAIAESQVVAVESLCRGAARPFMEVVPFRPMRVAFVLLEEATDGHSARLTTAVDEKLRWFGSTLTGTHVIPRDARLIADELRACLDDGNDLVLMAGGNTIDPLDPGVQALAMLGATLVHCGAPMRGSMSWLAEVGGVPILNLDSSRMYLGTTVGDVYLPLLLTGEPVTADELRRIGYGGFPGSGITSRFAPYTAEIERA